MNLPRVAFRPFTLDDLPLLAGWLDRPHVARWWREDPAVTAVEARYLPCLDGRDPTELFILESGGESAGFFQRYLVADDPEWASALSSTGQSGVETAIGIDYLIGEAPLTAHGLGTIAIAAFTRLALARYSATGLIAAVPQDNIASWRALEKVGYRRCWKGALASDHPSDEGPVYLYRLDRGDMYPWFWPSTT